MSFIKKKGRKEERKGRRQDRKDRRREGGRKTGRKNKTLVSLRLNICSVI